MDLLLFILIFLGILFFNYVTRQAARRRQEEEARARAAQQPAPPVAQEQPLEDIWGRAPAAVPAPAPAPVHAVRKESATPPARRLHPGRALLTDRRDLRRAVVLMMVLGPCRAQEPPER